MAWHYLDLIFYWFPQIQQFGPKQIVKEQWRQVIPFICSIIGNQFIMLKNSLFKNLLNFYMGSIHFLSTNIFGKCFHNNLNVNQIELNKQQQKNIISFMFYNKITIMDKQWVEKNKQSKQREDKSSTNNRDVYQKAPHRQEIDKNDRDSDDDSSQQDQGENAVLSQQQDKYIFDPHQYLSFCMKNKKIKVMDQRNPILNNVYLKDISLHKKGPLEDKIYSKNNFYYCNIRRGNTLCQIYNEKQQQSDLFMCRRGMKKFYDLEPEYLKVNRQLTYQHLRYRRRIFEKLDKSIETHKINLYCLFKQNGEHCQVSYLKQLGYWLFASKNVAIIAKNVEDLQNYYEKERFYWAKLIGHEFFKILSKFTQNQKQEFIKDIDGKTLLGQHCGYEEHQHITKYEKIQLIFYGLVQNNGIDHCLPVDQCQSFLKKYKLNMSRMQKVEGLAQKNKVYLNMYRMLKNIGEGTMDQCGQGSVMYMVAEDQNGKQRTVGMCKLKTCEYLIYRKMREMIKIYFAKKGATANSFEKFKFQIDNLCSTYFKPPKPLQYYYQIAQEAFNQVRKNGKDFSDDEFRYKFVNFLQNIEKRAKQRKEQKQNNMQKNQQPIRIILICSPLLQQQSSKLQKSCKAQGFSIEYAYRQIPNQKLIKSTLHILHMVPRMNLNELQSNTAIITYETSIQDTQKIVAELQQNGDIKKSHLITFIKSQDKPKSIQLLQQKIRAFTHQLQQRNNQENKVKYRLVKNINQLIQFIENSSELNINVQPKIQVQKTIDFAQKPHIIVIMTLLIPGSGKSSLAQTMLNMYPQDEINVISSDKIRQNIMQKYKAKRGSDEVQSEQAYAATKKKGLQKYRQTISIAIGEQPPTQNQIIFIDRVFCPTTILENIQQLNKPWTKFIIVTETQLVAKFNDYNYPHSMTYLLGCIKRCLQREQHETLSSKPNQIVKVILKFYQMYRGFTYNKLSRQLEEQNIQFTILPLEFVQEKQQEAENLFLKKKVQECLKRISPGHDAPDCDLYPELIELIYKYSEHIERKKTQESQMEKEEQLKANAQKLYKACK